MSLKARVLREPLVHFLLAGAALFAFNIWRGEDADPASRTITLDAAQLAALTDNWSRTWQRAPNRAELDGIIREHVREEVYYREALRIGLDRDDAFVRRRMRNKMEALARSAADTAQPGDAELKAFFESDPARYASDPRLSFDQQLTGAAANPLPAHFEAQSASEIDAIFGPGFAAGLAKLPLGQWAGNIPSGLGTHRVRVRDRSAAKMPNLSDVRADVERDWRAETRRARVEAAYQALLDGYTIKIAKPE
jgi:peptidyl-prolyl cis-trans isomerase C